MIMVIDVEMYFFVYRVNGNEMGRACGAYGGGEGGV